MLCFSARILVLTFCLFACFFTYSIFFLFSFLVILMIAINGFFKVSKGAKIRIRYNQVPHLTQDTNEKVTNSLIDITYESQEVSPFPAGDQMAHINRRALRHSKHKIEKT